MLHKEDDGEESAERAGQGPDLRHLMASVIRLLANCTVSDCPTERQTLHHLMGYLLKHPGMADAPAAQAAIRRAAMICAVTLSPQPVDRPDGLH